VDIETLRTAAEGDREVAQGQLSFYNATEKPGDLGRHFRTSLAGFPKIGLSKIFFEAGEVAP